MRDVAELLRGIGALAWPLVIGFALYLFREEFRDLIRRIRRGKVLGQEITLDRSLDELHQVTTTLAESPPPALSRPSTSGDQVARESVGPNDHDKNLIEGELAPQAARDAELIREILEEASRSPKVGLILLASTLEGQMRRLLAGYGRAQLIGPGLERLADTVTGAANVPHGFLEAVRQFAAVRNQIVHGGQGVSDDEVLRAIDSGITLLQWLQAVPREINIVYHPGTEVFADAEGKVKRDGVLAIILETTSPGGAVKTRRVFPTTRTHFIKGREVAWEWNMNAQVQWGESWYRDPDTGEIRQAWGSSMEFIGRHMDQV